MMLDLARVFGKGLRGVRSSGSSGGACSEIAVSELVYSFVCGRPPASGFFGPHLVSNK